MIQIKNISELFPDEPIRDPFDEEIQFNDTVREYIVCGLLLVVLSVASHVVLLRYRRRETSTVPRLLPSSRDRRQQDDEAIVDTIALWLCTFSLTVSLGAVLLLPISILGNEVLTVYRNSSYVRWINVSLIQGMWNMIFLFSNLALFVGLPFAYLFTESEGLPGSKKGLKARIIETVIVLTLLVVLVFGVAFILSFLLGYYEDESFTHVIVFTPLGFAHLFTAIGGLVMKPGGFLRDLTEEYYVALLREEALAHKLHHSEALYQHTSLAKNALPSYDALLSSYKEARDSRIKLDKRRRAGMLRRNLSYPVALLLLLLLTSTAVVIVGLNTLQLLVGIKALPLSSAPAMLGEAQQGKRFVLLGMIGPAGALLEILLILYLIAASFVGCYSLPFLKSIRPCKKDTPMVHIIYNCIIVLVLSSALPLLSRTLGITNFDLLGDYGRIGWLGNFWIVLAYNVLFATAAAWCLVKKFTATLRHAIYNRFKFLAMSLVPRDVFRLPAQVMNGGLINSTSGVKEE